MRDSNRTITLILQAAERVVVHSGVEKTTIDEVAREAGVSKGGVLHHFPSKESIIVALVTKQIARFEADLAERKQADPDPDGSFTRAFLNTVTNADGRRVEVCFALHTAFRNVPQLEDILNSANRRWQLQIEQDGIDPVLASVVRLAADGLWLASLHRVTVPSADVREALLHYLTELTHKRGWAELPHTGTPAAVTTKRNLTTAAPRH